MSETPTTPHASRFTELTTEQLEANRRSVYAYAVPPAPELLSGERLAEIAEATLYDFEQAPEFAIRDVTDLLAHIDAQSEMIRLLTMRADSAEWAVAEIRDELAAAEARATEAEAQVAMLRVELEVEQAKTALLWPVATKQHLTHPGGGHLIICECSARSDNECTCKESQATL